MKDKSGRDGYKVEYKSSFGKKKKASFTTKGIVFSGGVVGTVPLLLKLKQHSLTNLSDKVGCNIRTNNESLIELSEFITDLENGRNDAKICISFEPRNTLKLYYASIFKIYFIINSPLTLLEKEKYLLTITSPPLPEMFEPEPNVK